MRSLSITFLLFIALSLSAQSNNDTETYRSEIHLRDSLSERIEAIVKSLQQMSMEYKSLQKQHDILGENIANQEQRLHKLQQSSTIAEVEDLRIQIDTLNSGIEWLSEKRDSLQEMYTIEKDKADINADKKSELNENRNDLVQQIFNDNGQYINCSFQKMNLTTLAQIEQQCYEYNDAPQIQEFINKIATAKRNKNIYDSLVVVVNTRYDKVAISKALRRVEKIQPMSEIQKNEKRDVQRQLNAFADGLQAFKEFLKLFIAIREKIGLEKYDKNYVKPDIKKVREQSNLALRIDEKLLIVPYLRERYNTFIDDITRNPTQESPVEQEILNQ